MIFLHYVPPSFKAVFHLPSFREMSLAEPNPMTTHYFFPSFSAMTSSCDNFLQIIKTISFHKGPTTIILLLPRRKLIFFWNLRSSNTDIFLFLIMQIHTCKPNITLIFALATGYISHFWRNNFLEVSLAETFSLADPLLIAVGICLFPSPKWKEKAQ